MYSRKETALPTTEQASVPTGRHAATITSESYPKGKEKENQKVKAVAKTKVKEKPKVSQRRSLQPYRKNKEKIGEGLRANDEANLIKIVHHNDNAELNQCRRSQRHRKSYVA